MFQQDVDWACSIVNAQTNLATDDPTGPVDGGFLLLEGDLTPVFIRSGELYNTNKVTTSVYLDRPINEDADFYLFPLWSRGSNTLEDQIWTWLHIFLILTAVRDQFGSYQRCGLCENEASFIFTTGSDPIEKERVKESRALFLGKVVQGSQGNIPSEGCSSSGNGYKIRIV